MIAASNAQKKRSSPCPNGWVSSGRRLPRDSDTSRKTWLRQSASECAASARSALEPVVNPPPSLAAAITRFANEGEDDGPSVLTVHGA